MKKSYIAILGILVIAGVAAYFWFSNPLGSILKAAIEKFGPEMTQTTVRVGKVNISPTTGQGSLSGLLVGNPKGFKTDYALKADNIEVELDVASITKDVVVIHRVSIESPHIIYEKGSGGTNFDAIQRNVEQSLGVDRSKGKSADKEPGKKLIIEVFSIRNAKVSYGDALSLPLPDIELHNIGKDKGGASSASVVKSIIGAVNGKLVGSIARGVVEGVGSAVKGVGGLFGK